jgi:hypothetical protein
MRMGGREMWGEEEIKEDKSTTLSSFLSFF